MFCLLLSFAHLLGWRKLMRSSSKLYDFLNVLFHSGQKVSSPKMSLPNQLCFSETRAVTSFVWVIWTVQIVLQNFWPLQTTDESQSLFPPAEHDRAHQVALWVAFWLHCVSLSRSKSGYVCRHSLWNLQHYIHLNAPFIQHFFKWIRRHFTFVNHDFLI